MVEKRIYCCLKRYKICSESVSHGRSVERNAYSPVAKCKTDLNASFPTHEPDQANRLSHVTATRLLTSKEACARRHVTSRLVTVGKRYGLAENSRSFESKMAKLSAAITSKLSYSISNCLPLYD